MFGVIYLHWVLGDQSVQQHQGSQSCPMNQAHYNSTVKPTLRIRKRETLSLWKIIMGLEIGLELEQRALSFR